MRTEQEGLKEKLIRVLPSQDLRCEAANFLCNLCDSSGILGKCRSNQHFLGLDIIRHEVAAALQLFGNFRTAAVQPFLFLQKSLDISQKLR